MIEKLKQISKEEVEKLPTDIQQAINSFDWVSKSAEIAKKYALPETELSDFQVEILLILVGLENPDLFIHNIEYNVGKLKSEAEKISEDTFKQIFMPINELAIENVKKSERSKETSFEKNLNFILSGGDYSTFLSTSKIDTSENTPTPEVKKQVIPPKSGKMDDIKSKFVI